MDFFDALIEDNSAIMTRGSTILIILLFSMVPSIKREYKIRKHSPEME